MGDINPNAFYFIIRQYVACISVCVFIFVNIIAEIH